MQPPASFYDLETPLNNGTVMKFGDLRGKKLLLVNTASDCGYTPQYKELQQLQDAYKDQLLVIGFPANDFKEQEKGTDQEIAAFCSLNYGISFPLAKKSSVVKGPGQHPVFAWLSDKKLNGWNDQAPVWNFCKYLVSETGELVQYFEPGVSPMAAEMIEKLKS